MRSLWPPLPLAGWIDTYQTLHRYLQIVGKVRLQLTPLVNHYWNVALHLTPRGLTTRATPYEGRTFAIDFDFVDHDVEISTSDGARRTLALVPRTVADFYAELMALLASVGIHVEIWDHPVEILTDPIPFHLDRSHAAYDPEAVGRWFRILRQSAVVMEAFRARFVGKCSPVHFFWGAFDLAVSRFSGRLAPPQPGADPITAESYSHEVSSAGFWPGDERYEAPAFYAYTVPTPEALPEWPVRPPARWSPTLREFVLPYDAVRTASSPRTMLLDFFQRAYEGGAELGGWDRSALERAGVPAEGHVPAP